MDDRQSNDSTNSHLCRLKLLLVEYLTLWIRLYGTGKSQAATTTCTRSNKGAKDGEDDGEWNGLRQQIEISSPPFKFSIDFQSFE